MKFNKALLAIPLAMGLDVLGAAPAHADNINTDGVITASDSNGIQVGLTKLLEMPIGTANPDVAFTFAATPVSVDEGNSPIQDAPNLNVETVDPSNPIMTTLDSTGIDGSTEGDVTTVTMNSGDILQGVVFPHAGTYQYTIPETNLPSSNFPGDTPYIQWDASTAQYTLTVYVANCTADTNCADGQSVYVYAVTDAIAKLDASNPDGSSVGDKVDPTPGDQQAGGQSGMVFTNKYVKTNNSGGNDPTTGQTLSISKTVTGALGDQTKYFNFSVTVNPSSLDVTRIQSETEQNPIPYYAYIMQDGAIVTDTNSLLNNGWDGNADVQGRPCFVIYAGTPQSFSLKSGQSLAFVDTAVGTSYDVSEATAPGYDPSYTVTTSQTQGSVVTGDPNTSLDTGSQLVGDNTTTGIDTADTLGINSADYVNDRSVNPLTGLTMSQLPFVGLFAVVLLALVAFIVVRARAGKKAQAAA